MSPRKIAIENNNKTFRSGNDCKNGHINPERYTTSSSCVLCMDVYNKSERGKNLKREYRKNNPDKIKISRKNYSDSEIGKKKSCEYRWLSRGLTINGRQFTSVDWKELYYKQEGKCFISSCDFTHHDCWWEQTTTGFHVHHIHETGEVIGLYCAECNLAEGMILKLGHQRVQEILEIQGNPKMILRDESLPHVMRDSFQEYLNENYPNLKYKIKLKNVGIKRVA